MHLSIKIEYLFGIMWIKRSSLGSISNILFGNVVIVVIVVSRRNLVQSTEPNKKCLRASNLWTI